MAVAALIKFTQLALIPPGGEALKGTAGSVVNIENTVNTDVASYTITLVDVPKGSAVVPGILAQADGNTPAASFVPDAVPGCYRIQLLVYPGIGQGGIPNQDIRNFSLPDSNGFVFPPYQEIPPKLPVLGSGHPGEKPDELNFGGQPFGWSGDGTDGLILHQLLSAAAGGPGVTPQPGWIRITNLTTQNPGTVTSKVWADPPGNTILDAATASEDTVSVEVEAGYPNVEVDGIPAVLPRVGDIYKDTVDITVSTPGPANYVAEVFDGDGNPGAKDTIAISVDAPPVILTAEFVDLIGGGAGAAGPGNTYPGAQTELKAGDQVRIIGTTDKNCDRIVALDVEVGTGQNVDFGASTNFDITITVADRGDAVQNLAAHLQARDATTAALGTTFETDSAATVDGVNRVKLNDLYPGISIGAVTYPGAQQALKGVETATVVNVLTDFDTVLYDDPTAAQLTIGSPAVSANPKSVDGTGSGVYNIITANFRITATRAANDAQTIDSAVVQIADLAATLSVVEPAARLRSGGLNGTSAQDHEINIVASQKLLNAPTLTPDAPNRGVFQGGGFLDSGDQITWNRDLRVDEAVPTEKGTFNWGAISGTNLAGTVTASITGDSQYVLGGFVARTFNFAAFTADSTESIIATDEAKIQSGSFSNGNPGVPQPFGTADTTDGGKEGWFAPTATPAASGTSVQMHMLHTPTVGANSGGLTLASLEETV